MSYKAPVDETTEKHHALVLKKARVNLTKAQDQYAEAITYAIEDGVSNNKIAKYIGLSETAIRKWRERRGL